MRDIERLGHLHNDLDNGFQLGSSIVHDSSGDPADLTANGANHIIRRQRSPDPLQLELADWLDLYGVLDFHQYPRTDENLSWLGFVAKPRGDVGNGADGGVVEAPLITNRAERGEAVRNADAETNVVPEAAPGRRRGSDGVTQFKRHETA